VEEEGLGGGKVKGVLPVKTVLVSYQDGHGKVETKLAVIIPGGEVYFFGREALDLRPAQKWLKKEVVELTKE
jgi:hypothetical protein